MLIRIAPQYQERGPVFKIDGTPQQSFNHFQLHQDNLRLCLGILT
jgi:hypothetical protein